MPQPNKHPWLKHKGYLHLTPQLNIIFRRKELLSKIQNKDYVSTYGFFPLIHATIKERKYKKVDKNSNDRSHTKLDKTGKVKISTAKKRPLHYASHMDALIFGYYANILQEAYEKRINTHAGLSDSIIAYRKIPTGIDDKNKSTVHFAKECFDEIAKRGDDCYVLTFDIESFFSSLDHVKLKKYWADIIGEERLPSDHYNVYKAATNFRYILKDDLRLTQNKHGRREGFDEKHLALVRKKGSFAYFESSRELKEKIKTKQIRVYKNQFIKNINGQRIPRGIPQGLPISSVLANLYLLEFDLKILKEVVNKRLGFYRRYSDDILIVCKKSDVDFIKSFVDESLKESEVEISKDKTEIFVFENILTSKGMGQLTSVKLSNSKRKENVPLTYLGFEFYGYKTLIKSANLAKFYRRMIYTVKSKSRRALKLAEETYTRPVLFQRQLYKLYTLQDLNATKIRKNWKRLSKTDFGDYKLITGAKEHDLRSNYLSYVKRASHILGEPLLLNQIKNHKKIFNEAIHRHLNSKIKS